MARAICVVPWVSNVEAPTWTLAVVAANGDRAPGYAFIGSAPRRSGVDSAILWCDASDACMAAIIADDVNYVYVEDITPAVEEPPAPGPMMASAPAGGKPDEKLAKPSKEDGRKAKLTAAKKAKVKTFLKTHGHNDKATTINAASLVDVDAVIVLLCDLYAIDRAGQYEPATAG